MGLLNFFKKKDDNTDTLTIQPKVSLQNPDYYDIDLIHPDVFQQNLPKINDPTNDLALIASILNRSVEISILKPELGLKYIIENHKLTITYVRCNMRADIVTDMDIRYIPIPKLEEITQEIEKFMI